MWPTARSDRRAGKRGGGGKTRRGDYAAAAEKRGENHIPIDTDRHQSTPIDTDLHQSTPIDANQR
jgi:hypothetical protein